MSELKIEDLITEGDSKEIIKNRFWDKVDIDSINSENDCWNWIGPTGGSKPYGCFSVGSKNRRAHRISYLIYIGPIPNKLHVLHSCDNISCINPKHLFLGTQKDNMNDKMNKGRHKTNGYENKTKCKRGHLFDEYNTIFRSDGSRKCRECNRLFLQERNGL